MPVRREALGAWFERNELSITLELHSTQAIKDFAAVSKMYPFQIRERTPNLIKAEYFADNVELKEDLAVRYSLDPTAADALHIITERETASGPDSSRLRRFSECRPLHRLPRRLHGLDGSFRRFALYAMGQAGARFRACETALRRLRPTDSFNLLLFNSKVNRFAPQPRKATPENIG